MGSIAAEELKKKKKRKKVEVKKCRITHSSDTVRHESSNIPRGHEGQAICKQHDFVID